MASRHGGWNYGHDSGISEICGSVVHLRIFIQGNSGYGDIHKAQLGDREMKVLPLAHPRQIARLGRSAVSWYRMHQEWIANQARDVI